MANEKRLIDANAFWNRLRQVVYDIAENDDFGRLQLGYSPDLIAEVLKQAPTVDAVEVVHGRWEPHYETFDEDPAVGVLGGEYQTGWQCSVCGRYEPSKEPYCNCGAKMDGDGNG